MALSLALSGKPSYRYANPDSLEVSAEKFSIYIGTYNIRFFLEKG